MPITYRSLLPTMGAEVLGFDPTAPLDPATAKALYAGLQQHRLLVFRGADLTEEQQVALTQIAGEVTLRGASGTKKAKATLVSNTQEGGLFGSGELSFHSDLSFTEHILKARSLHALLLPSSDAGGETLFSDVQTAYEELDAELKSRAAPLLARFAVTYNYGDRQVVYDFVRPIIGTHPHTGRRFIAASRAVTKEIIGMERAEYRPLLKRLWEHMERPKYVYRHSWKLGDTVLWDNIGLQHARTPFDPSEKRALRAVSVDEPWIAVKQAANVAATAAY